MAKKKIQETEQVNDPAPKEQEKPVSDILESKEQIFNFSKVVPNPTQPPQVKVDSWGQNKSKNK